MSADSLHRLVILAVLVPLAAVGCRQGMYDDVKYEPYEKSELFPNQTSARPLPAGTVARGMLAADRVLATGLGPDGTFAANPLPVSREVLVRGQQRFDVFCSPCHDRVGTGNGMIVRRGYTRPPSFHEERLRQIEDGHLFDVITRGYGQMPSYASQVAVEDRWAIVAYVRALQLSQHAQLAALPAEVRQIAAQALATAGTAEPAGVAEAAAPIGQVPDTAGDVPPAPVTGDTGPAPAAAPEPSAVEEPTP